MDNNRNILHRFGDFLDNYGWESSNVLPGILYTIIGTYLGKENTILHSNRFFDVKSHHLLWLGLLVVLGINIYILYRVHKKTKKIKDLHEKIKELDDLNCSQGIYIQSLEQTIEKYEKDNYYLFKQILGSMAYSLNFNGSERVSLYKRNQDKLSLMCRYSINDKFDQIRRTHYPLNKGFIGKAMLKGEFYIDNLPKSGKLYYKAVMAACDIDIESLRQMNMKSRSFYCKALMDSTNTVRNAVVVFESTECNRLDRVLIDRLIQTEHDKILAFIERLNFKVPSADTSLAVNSDL